MQLLAAPIFGEGFASPFNDVLDLAPTWTASVLLITGFSTRRWLIVAGWIAVALVVALLVWHFHHAS